MQHAQVEQGPLQERCGKVKKNERQYRLFLFLSFASQEILSKKDLELS